MTRRPHSVDLLNSRQNSYTSPLDSDFLVYCERLGPGLLAEPVNLISNAGFLVAGAWALGRCRRLGLELRHWDIWVLSLLMLAVGIGSASWHSFHTAWAETLDKLPILVFIHVYLYSFLHRQAGMNPAVAVIVTALFFGASKGYNALVDPGLLNGSVFYAPALVALAALVAWSYAAAAPARRVMAAALLVLITSLVFRTVDGEACASTPVGTHFVWHLLNALLLGMLVAVVMPRRRA